MKQILITLILLSLSILFLEAQTIAVIAGMAGDITLVRDNKTIKVKNGEVLKNFDEIRSGEESYAAIRFIDNGATTKLFPNSILVINTEQNGKTLNKLNKLNKGTIQSKVTPKMGGYIVETPNTVASVKGTDFITRYLSNLTTIGVLEGEVEVRNKKSDKFMLSKADQVFKSDDEGNVEEEQGGDFLDEFNGEDGAQNTNPQGTGEVNTLEIEIQKPDGTIKKVRISYE